MRTRTILITWCVVFSIATLCLPAEGQAPQSPNLWTYHWELDETPEGQESATPVAPVEVTFLDELIEIASHSASLTLLRKYSVHLGPEWSSGHAYRLLQTFESIPQHINNLRADAPSVEASLWRLSDRHIHTDIKMKYRDGQRIVTVSTEAFVHATPLLAEIDGVRGRYFSKRLHHAVVRLVTDNGADRYALERILQERYAVSINIPDYSELTRHTTGEHAERFSEFKNEELIALVSMLEEYPSGMLKTPGLKYLVRRLDGTPHPTNPTAAAVAWTSAGYIEFMESAFKEHGLDSIHRLILHEKAHFLWDHLFDDQLKEDWIELGGWFKNPDAKDGWSTTKQVEFVSAYAHGVNPNEDMAESISFYIINPDKLRSRSPAKYEFIQNRVMHGSRYISKIREDLTFEVYNLYPDYVYPGRIIRVDIQVNRAPEEDKQITVEIEIHGENDLDTAQSASAQIRGPKGNSEWIHFSPVDTNGQRIQSGHILRGHFTLSRYAANGYWLLGAMRLQDANGNERYSGQTDFGGKLYINNPLESLKPPEYIKNSVQLSLSEAITEKGKPYQIVTIRWRIAPSHVPLTGCSIAMNDENPETYSVSGGAAYWREKGKDLAQKGEVTGDIIIADYRQSGTYTLSSIGVGNVAGQISKIYFTPRDKLQKNQHVILDEGPYTIEIQTKNPDSTPPVLDLNRITIQAEPTHPEAPNGETQVDITFRIKDNISGYSSAHIYLRDPQGVTHPFWHARPDRGEVYFDGDPTVYQNYHKTIVLPVGSVPGTWGLAEMNVHDKAQNTLRADFTEIVRFEVEEGAPTAPEIALLPDDTQLLANYPNPFNPETWIPYQLANSSDVQITIYDIRGLLIRTLALGHQSAGYYTGRSRAAYWGGRNALGERVASGIYFYQLQTDEISSMRKMLILK